MSELQGDSTAVKLRKLLIVCVICLGTIAGLVLLIDAFAG